MDERVVDEIRKWLPSESYVSIVPNDPRRCDGCGGFWESAWHREGRIDQNGLPRPVADDDFVCATAAAQMLLTHIATLDTALAASRAQAQTLLAKLEGMGTRYIFGSGEAPITIYVPESEMANWLKYRVAQQHAEEKLRDAERALAEYKAEHGRCMADATNRESAALERAEHAEQSVAGDKERTMLLRQCRPYVTPSLQHAIDVALTPPVAPSGGAA